MAPLRTALPLLFALLAGLLPLAVAQDLEPAERLRLLLEAELGGARLHPGMTPADERIVPGGLPVFAGDEHLGAVELAADHWRVLVRTDLPAPEAWDRYALAFRRAGWRRLGRTLTPAPRRAANAELYCGPQGRGALVVTEPRSLPPFEWIKLGETVTWAGADAPTPVEVQLWVRLEPLCLPEADAEALGDWLVAAARARSRSLRGSHSMYYVGPVSFGTDFSAKRTYRLQGGRSPLTVLDEKLPKDWRVRAREDAAGLGRRELEHAAGLVATVVAAELPGGRWLGIEAGAPEAPPRARVDPADEASLLALASAYAPAAAARARALAAATGTPPPDLPSPGGAAELLGWSGERGALVASWRSADAPTVAAGRLLDAAAAAGWRAHAPVPADAWVARVAGCTPLHQRFEAEALPHAGATTVRLHVDSYTPDHCRRTERRELRLGGDHPWPLADREAAPSDPDLAPFELRFVLPVGWKGGGSAVPDRRGPFGIAAHYCGPFGLAEAAAQARRAAEARGWELLGALEAEARRWTAWRAGEAGSVLLAVGPSSRGPSCVEWGLYGWPAR